MNLQNIGRHQLEVADVFRGPDGVVRIQFHPVKKHGIEQAKQVVEAHNALACEVPCGVLADLTAVTTGADKQAREYYIGPEASRLKTAMAMVVGSPLQRMLGNIFLKISRPPYPSQLFADEGSALLWLKTFDAAPK